MRDVGRAKGLRGANCRRQAEGQRPARSVCYAIAGTSIRRIIGVEYLNLRDSPTRTRVERVRQANDPRNTLSSAVQTQSSSARFALALGQAGIRPRAPRKAKRSEKRQRFGVGAERYTELQQVAEKRRSPKGRCAPAANPVAGSSSRIPGTDRATAAGSPATASSRTTSGTGAGAAGRASASASRQAAASSPCPGFAVTIPCSGGTGRGERRGVADRHCRLPGGTLRRCGDGAGNNGRRARRDRARTVLPGVQSCGPGAQRRPGGIRARECPVWAPVGGPDRSIRGRSTCHLSRILAAIG